MKLDLYRYSQKNGSTLGLLFIDCNFFCYTLEDVPRPEKIKGKTAIPAGTYQIKPRPVLSEMTKQYRKIYDFFRFHLELQNVPDFKYIYIHHGNFAKDTDGCILVGSQPFPVQSKEQMILDSRSIFEVLYKKVYPYAIKGELEITIYEL